MTNKIKIKLLDSRITLPTKATSGSAGFDLQACINEELVLMPGESTLVPTGLAIHIDKKEYVSFILPRSKLGAKKGIVLGNLTGVIDSDYQGQWFVSVWNRNFNEPVSIVPMEQIAQAVFLKLADIEFQVVEDFEVETSRNDGGISKEVNTVEETEVIIDSTDFVCTHCGSSKFINYYSTNTVECTHCNTVFTTDNLVNIKHQRG